jgi:hypothetical protein
MFSHAPLQARTCLQSWVVFAQLAVMFLKMREVAYFSNIDYCSLFRDAELSGATKLPRSRRSR